MLGRCLPGRLECCGEYLPQRCQIDCLLWTDSWTIFERALHTHDTGMASLKQTSQRPSILAGGVDANLPYLEKKHPEFTYPHLEKSDKFISCFRKGEKNVPVSLVRKSVSRSGEFWVAWTPGWFAFERVLCKWIYSASEVTDSVYVRVADWGGECLHETVSGNVLVVLAKGPGLKDRWIAKDQQFGELARDRSSKGLQNVRLWRI